MEQGANLNSAKSLGRLLPTTRPGLGLMTLVLDAVQEVPWPTKAEFFSIRPGEKFRSEILLALLTYCYATGNYGSREVEGMAATDPLLCSLSGSGIPDWKTLRRFRRIHRDTLRECIRVVLHGAIRVRFGEGKDEALADHCVAVALDQWFEPLCVPFPDREAVDRIERAVFVDELSE